MKKVVEMPGKTMYCALATRLRHLKEIVRTDARNLGYAPCIPFDLGAFEDFESNPRIGRPKTLKLMLHVKNGFDVNGTYAISDGTMLELEDSLNNGQEVRVRYGFDPEWEYWYETLRPKYGDLFARLRGPHNLIALVGPSAVGKTFWSDRFLEYFGNRLRKVKNTTTRDERKDNPKDKESYNFISEKEFRERIEDFRFLEWDSYLGNFYGSSMDDIKAVLKENSGIFAITPTGAKALYERRFEINLNFVVLVPDSQKVLEENFDQRGTPREKRVEFLEEAKKFILPPEIPHHVVRITRSTEKDRQELLRIVEPLIVK